MDQKYQHYVRDSLHELIARAREAKASGGEHTVRGKASSEPFDAGRALAYYEVVSYLVNQLDAFGIARSTVEVPATFDAERELL